VTKKRTNSLFLRVFAYGIILLLASAAAATALDQYVLRPPHVKGVNHFEIWMAAQLCTRSAPLHSSDTPDAVPNLPGEPGHPFAATLYSANDEMLDTSVTPPYPPLTPDERAVMQSDGHVSVGSTGARMYPCPEGAKASYVAFQGPPSRLPLHDVVALFAIAFLVVVIASVPLARSIAAPIENVVATTRAFGGGNLAARAKVGGGGEIGDLAVAFNDMADRLEHHMRAEKELLANMSHELRTPLSRMRVVLEMAQENPVRAASLLDEINTDLFDLEKLVGDVMDTIRLDATVTTVPPRLELTDAGAVVRNAVRRFETLHPARKLEVTIEPDLPEIAADPRLLLRLLENLLTNAGKYSDEGTTIDVRVLASGEDVLVEVEDRGIGIGRADLEHVFTPFFRAVRSRTRATGGAGLGLALSKRIAEIFGGSISIASELRKGTTVTVKLVKDADLQHFETLS
jgi:signal transduction histidine kinase